MGVYKGSSVFFYNAPFVTFGVAGAAGSEQSFTLQTQSDADFECQKLMSNVALQLTNIVTNNTLEVLQGLHYPALTLQIVDTNTGEQWFSQPTSIPNVCGVAQTPMILPQTKLISRSTSLLITVKNLYTNEAFALVNITLFGRKLYR